MAGKNSGDNRTRTSVSIFIIAGLCCFFYLLGAWQRSGFGKGDSIAVAVTKTAGENCDILPNLNFETRHAGEAGGTDESEEVEELKPCDPQYTDYTPCQDQKRAMTFPRENMNYRERHCPPQEEKLHCLIPAPKGYVTPFPWPKSRDYVPYANAPYKSLTVEKAIQNWVQYEGNFFRFPGGGTQFPQGADKYIDQLASVVPIENGTVRTALDTGCGVASWGAYLWKRNVIAMSFAPRDSHEAQVQFALERGVPAVIGVLGTIKMPYPSKAFDMAHCSRCLIPWGAADGILMMEVDRVLRPGGYWVLSGPPINWKVNFKAWQRPKEDLEEEQRKIEEAAKLLCWEKISEKGETAIWQKRKDSASCRSAQENSAARVCKPSDPDSVWFPLEHVKKVQYVNLNCLGGRKFTKYAGQSICHNMIRYNKMEMCITPNTGNGGDESLKPFPERLYAVPPRIANGLVSGVSVAKYQEDSKKWKKHVSPYKKINKLLDTGRYRNIMDMNAGLGGFAAALHSPKFWVMNVMPTIAEKNTLGVIFERGLIETLISPGSMCFVYMLELRSILPPKCEAFSTYPRTYDLIHASGLFSLYKDKCEFEDILLEMDRILRPEGAVILRDNVDVLIKVKKIIGGMRWNFKLMDHEDGPLVPEKILVAVKQYWTLGDTNSTSSQ
uniref:Methyltransferase n=1 Tax=Solanum demissum TaxID=50514 RepID=Q6L3V5_SOLDE|nr:Methyltransferase family protein, putative [Solanum demissum]AAT38802.2 Methyltransferase family protein, putative [Solanum demissum]